jgi:hypothetical protein
MYRVSTFEVCDSHKWMRCVTINRSSAIPIGSKGVQDLHHVKAESAPLVRLVDALVEIRGADKAKHRIKG